MTILTLSLPDSMRAFVEDQAAKGGLGSTEEYLRILIREAQVRADKAKLEAMLLEALESGEPVEMDDAYWERFRARLAERHGRADVP